MSAAALAQLTATRSNKQTSNKQSQRCGIC